MGYLEDLTETSNLGLRFVTSDMSMRASTFAPRSAQTSTGIYQIDIDAKMKQIQTSAASLDVDVQRNVVDPVFRNAWDAWYANWSAYVRETQKILNKLFSNPFRTDEINQQVESYRAQLIGWFDDYPLQLGRDGQRLGSSAGHPPIKPPDDKSQGGSSLPWWFWVMGGVGLVGVSYLIYRKVHEGAAKLRVVDKYVPAILDKHLGPLGKPALEYSKAGRDPDTSFSPFQLSTYDRDPSPAPATHRGFPLRNEMLFEDTPQRLPPRPRARDYDDDDLDDLFDDDEEYDE